MGSIPHGVALLFTLKQRVVLGLVDFFALLPLCCHMQVEGAIAQQTEGMWMEGATEESLQRFGLLC